MATYCQFCDKEMMFEKQATIVEDYITCGASSCQLKAKGNAKETKDAQAQFDADKIKVCIFESKDFQDVDSWKLIYEDKHPEFLSRPEIMGHLLKGGIVTIECEDGDISYCAKTAKEVHSDVKKYFENEGMGA